ncbi:MULTISPECIES: FAD-dependent monooxygenase [Candidatus Ichthyocystis]|uniref:FAD-dependent monooxygenase n=1 Tax=Candidatus Ichthyocystis TaxID=2929841 RepID=UPI000B80A4FE|nr:MULTISPECIES: FAD-dependent monooxygenase [Ichthyocystis]
MTDFYPFIIVGAGPVGLTLMSALSRANFSPVLFGTDDLPSSKDARCIVLMLENAKYLCSQGLLSLDDLSPIDRTDIFHASGFSKLTVRASDYNEHHLAYCVDYTKLFSLMRVNSLQNSYSQNIFLGMRYISHEVCSEYVNVLFERKDGSIYNCRSSHLVVTCPLKSNFLNATSSVKHYAALGTISLPCATPRCAYEILGKFSVTALLPQDNHEWRFIEMLTDSSLLSTSSVSNRLRFSVASHLGYIGNIEHVVSSEIPVFFRLNFTQENRVLFMGSSAQALHPIGARGINFSLSNVRSLVNCMRQSATSGQGSALMAFSCYEKECYCKRKMLWYSTDSLSRYLTHRRALFSLLEDCGLFVFNGSKILKSVLRRIIYSSC